MGFYTRTKKSKPIKSINMFKLKLNLTTYVLPLLVLSLVYLTGCGKDDNTNDTTQPQASYIPPNTDADGVMIGIKTINFISQAGFEFEQEVNTGVAAFGNLQTGDFEDVGTIDLGGELFERVSNNSYTYTFDASSITTGGTLGLDLEPTYTWNVAGGGNYGAFSHTVNMGFADIGKITSNTETISSSASYTLSVQSITGADSVYYSIAGPDGSVMAVTAGNVISHTFSAADMGTLGSGFGLVQVAAVKYSAANKGGQDIWFLNETVVTDNVDID